MSEMLSPAVYLRCLENSTENPWKGLAWRPAMNPSTMNLARRSSRATWRITSGFRYFSAVLAKRSPPRKEPSHLDTRPDPRRFARPADAPTSAPLRGGVPDASAVVLGDLGLADLGDQPADQAVGGLPLGLRLEIGANPVPEHGDGDLADVVERHAEAAVHRGHRLPPQDQVLAGAGAGAVVDQVLDELGRPIVAGPRRAHQSGHVIDGVFRDRHRGDQPLEVHDR